MWKLNNLIAQSPLIILNNIQSHEIPFKVRTFRNLQYINIFQVYNIYSPFDGPLEQMRALLNILSNFHFNF